MAILRSSAIFPIRSRSTLSMLHFRTSTTLDFDFITEGLGIDPEIIDYVISSYTVDMRIIRTRFWAPNLQLHCGKIVNGAMQSDTWVHVHTFSNGGIYHAKFILITTRNVLRFIFTTANMTWPMINGTTWNDYVRITIPRMYGDHGHCRNENTLRLKQFFDTFGIKTQIDIERYDWSMLKLMITTTIPGVTSHTIQLRERSSTFTETEIATASIVSDFNLSRYINTGKCIVYRPRNTFNEDMKNPKSAQCFLINIRENCTWYAFQYIENIRKYHVKRYIFSTTHGRFVLFTSANLTSSAWNGKNAELGIFSRSSNIYQITTALDK